MRLWHYKILLFLPDSQLLAQWRELNSIFKNQPKHILIDYVYLYPKENLWAYAELVIEEMDRRGFKIKSFDNILNYVKGTKYLKMDNPFPRHHDKQYLIQCFYNLQEKYIRGQKDFDRIKYHNLKSYVAFVLGIKEVL